MAGNSIGHTFKLTSFGESHGPAIGGVIDGCPAGLKIDRDFIYTELQRRKTASGPAASSRNEKDNVEFLSGLLGDYTTGTPLAFIIRNKDQKPEDYDHLKKSYRPSHADFTYDQKYGIRDHRGGGRASARETAVRVVAGAIAKMILKTSSIAIAGFVSKIGQIELDKHYSECDLSLITESQVCCPDRSTSDQMIELLDVIKQKGDTVGGVITCIVTGAPVGLGEPVFDRFEADLAKAIMSINAVKGFDIGSGIKASEAFGSDHNDSMVNKDGKIHTLTNNAGGVLGGITNGEDIYFKAYFKPVATVMQNQESVDNQGNKVILKGKGRHDVCVVPRAVPIVEAMAAIVLVNFLFRNKSARI